MGYRWVIGKYGISMGDWLATMDQQMHSVIVCVLVICYIACCMADDIVLN